MSCDNDEEYDVVVDVLSKHRESLWKMTLRNMQSDYIGMNIMDDIRLKQIAEIDECIKMWKDHKIESGTLDGDTKANPSKA